MVQAGRTPSAHICSDSQPIKSGHYLLQSFIIFHMPCHGILVSRQNGIPLLCECHDSINKAFLSIMQNASRSGLPHISAECIADTTCREHIPTHLPNRLLNPGQFVPRIMDMEHQSHLHPWALPAQMSWSPVPPTRLPRWSCGSR